jgi:hypothetical protein
MELASQNAVSISRTRYVRSHILATANGEIMSNIISITKLAVESSQKFLKYYYSALKQCFEAAYSCVKR